MNVVLCVVENRDYVLLEYAKWLVQMATSNSLFGIVFYEGKRKPIWYTRRKLIEKALSNKDTTHVLFVDTDVIPTVDFLGKLAFGMSYTKADIVTGIYYQPDGTPVSRKDGKPYHGLDSKAIEEVDMGSMGLSLIKREVLEKVEYPEPEPHEKIDADIEFFRDVKKAGFKVVQDFGNRGVHLLLNSF